MALHWTPYAIAPMVAALSTAGLALYLLRFQLTRGGVFAVGLLGSIFLWTACTSLSHLALDLAVKITLNQVLHVGVVSVGPLAVGGALEVSGRGHLMDRRLAIALFAFPALYLCMAWTNVWHGLVWIDGTISTEGPFPALVLTHGPVFWIQVAYTYTLLAAAVAILARHFASNWELYRREAPLILGAMVVPMAANILYLSGRSPIPNADITGYSLSVTIVLLSIALLRDGSLEVSRIAPHEILDEMRDGMLVADDRGRIVYANRRAAQIVGLGLRRLPLIADALFSPGSAVHLLVVGEPVPGGVAELAKDGDLYEFTLSRVQHRRAGRGRDRLIAIQEVGDKRRAEQRIEQLAFFDPLTGLPNRHHFQRALEEAVRKAEHAGGELAVLFLDLDRFKQVNDSLGHGAGDELLRQMARRLEGALADSMGSGGLVARLGGDEFTILLHEGEAADDAAELSARVLRKLEAPVRVFGREIFCSASLGIAVHPADGESAEQLLLSADTAMYAAKAGGRGGFAFYEASLSSAASRRLELEGRLHHALDRRELSLVYQPVRDTLSGRVESAEALLRWRDPKLGDIAPEEFIPIAEHGGLIASLGEWTLHEVCRQLRAWEGEDFEAPRVMVNLSSHHLRRPGLVDTVRDALTRYEIEPRQIELEITESTIMHEDAATTAALLELEELGVGLSMDDFGTGYSSLANLRRFPFARLKIDRCFVAGLPDSPDDVAIVEAVIALGRSLGLEVVAEGVETRAQMDFLVSRGCSGLQGFLIAEPMRPEALTGLLRGGEVARDGECH